MKKSILSLFIFLAGWSVSEAEAPANYYKSCEGKSGKSLLGALFNVIGDHTVVSYDGLWNVYKTSDVRANGSVWDMYSTKEWVVGQQKCGNYKNVGDCINREHSFPKSWFNDGRPMYSDAFHLYPTDGKVNGQRSNFPYGECSGGTTLPPNGNVKALGRLGKSTFAGYSGTVFEPVDEYKGDFARSYFYMATAYYDKISSWNSDMLAGNNFPAFSSWALNLLLKWHRQDPVSDKEIKRNDAVYAYQHNRNPYIDHPELVEYIWGNKAGTNWSEGGEITAELASPYDGTTYDLGITGPGVERSLMIPVRGQGFTQPLSMSISGAGFSINTSSITADAVNSGRAGVVIYYKSNVVAESTGVLTLTSGSVKCTVKVTAKAVAGLPLQMPTDISETSFVVRWANVDGDGASYKLNLYLNDVLVDGYPVTVPAEDEFYLVENLEPATTYTYNITNGSLTSETRTVTTSTPLPSIQFLYDGDLYLTATVGEPSDVAELLLDIENISDDISIEVKEPFSVSTDKSSWSTEVTMVPGEERFYLRLYGETPGSYTTTLIAKGGDYVNDDVEVNGVILSPGAAVVEDFESGNWKNDYSRGNYEGTAGVWYLDDAGVYPEDSKIAYEGAGVCRLGKNVNSSLTTTWAKEGGIATVSFMAKPWGDDGDATIDVQYSSDRIDWTTAGTVTVSGNEFAEKKVAVNKPGSLYLRLQQRGGKRALIDNIEASNYSASSAVEELYYHSWDAFSRQGVLIVENRETSGSEFFIYGIDGIARFEGILPVGETELALPAGLYIVVNGDFARRVVVK